MAPNYGKKAIRGVALVAGTTFASAVFAYGLRVTIARNLSQEEYGLFYATLTLMLFLLVFRDFGLGSALTKYISQYMVEEDYSKIKTLVISALLFQSLFSLLLAASFVGFSSLLASTYFHSQKAKPILLLFALYVIISMFCRLIHYLLMGFQETRWYSVTEPIRVGVTFLSLFPLFHFGYGIFAPAIALLIGVSSALLVILFGTSKYFFIVHYPIRSFVQSTKELFSFATPVIFTGMGNKVIGYLDVLMLTYFVPLAAVGTYNVVLPTALLFLFWGRAVSQILFPMTSELWARGDKKRVYRSIKMVYTYVLLLTVPLISIAFVFGDVIISSFFGSQYTSGLLAFRILLIGVLANLIVINNNTMLGAIGKPLIVAKVIMLSAAVNIVLNITLIPSLQIVGAAIATAASFVTAFWTSAFEIKRHLGYPLPLPLFGKLAFVTMCVSMILWAAKFGVPLPSAGKFFVGVVLAGGCYIYLSLALKLTSVGKVKAILQHLLKKRRGAV